MIYKIYCIIDINGLKYVGKTYQTFKERLSKHRSDKKNNNGCSSEKLDLDNCEMILLCECDKSEVQYMEQYFKDNIKCVNIRNPYYNRKEYRKQYRENNKQKIDEWLKISQSKIKIKENNIEKIGQII